MNTIVNKVDNARFLRLTLLTGLLAASALPALAQTRYMDAKGKWQSSPVTATMLTGSGATTLNTGWYLCTGLLNYTGTLTISGDVTLILGDECDLRVSGDKDNAGINVTGENSLTITTTLGGALSSLTVNAYGDGAGIGGGNGEDGGSITINGGAVVAIASSVFTTGSNGTTSIGGGAGIGGGYAGDGGTITINGGTVHAIGSPWGSGIGGGAGRITDRRNDIFITTGGNGGTTTINGGTVIATAGGLGTNLINNVVGPGVNGGGYGAGIGGGEYGNGGTITINGGRVIATGTGGAGIGGGFGGDSEGGNGGRITIHGGIIDATGGVYAAGIGNGDQGGKNQDNGGVIAIHGGTVNATGGNKGAGIGGGLRGDGGTITIAGGTVNATGGNGSADIGQGGGYKDRVGAGVSTIPKPKDTAVAAGGDATFRVAVVTTGKPAPKIAYQWQQSTDDGKNWPDVTGATKATLKLSGVTASMNGNLFRCVARVWGIGEKSSITYTTAPARLTVSQ